MATQAPCTELLSVPENCCGFYAGAGQVKESLAQGLAQLSIIRPANRPQLQHLNTSSSPFSTPEPELLKSFVKERPLQVPSPALHLHSLPGDAEATPSQQGPYSSKSTLSECASGLLTTTYTAQLASAYSSCPGGFSPGPVSVSSQAPVCGVKAVCGKRAKMEDTFNVQPNFANVQMSLADGDFQNKLPARIASQVGEQLDQQTSPPSSLPLSPNSTSVPSLSASDAEPSVGGSSMSSDNGSGCDTLHFFGVYDGHGGVEAAQHCANRLHQHLSTALAMIAGSNATVQTHDAFCMADPSRTGVQCQAEWTLCPPDCPLLSDTPPPMEGCSKEQGDAAVARLFSSAVHADAECQAANHEASTGVHAACLESSSTDSDSASNGSEPARSDTTACMSEALEGALRSAFLKTDEEFAEDGSSAMVGSTAVVALVGTKKMWIANCGDSRAVLCRGSKAIQVTDDHKPEREDEAERVEKAGGQVLYWNGHRVMGVLAMSRAIGDHGLRPYVIPEPEITVLSRVVEDDFLLLASDGLWDVMTNQEAITLAMRCLLRSWDKGTSRKAAVRVAATVLTRAAVDRGSKDNVTVVIIDLKAPQPTSSDGKQDSLCACPCDPCAPSSPMELSPSCPPQRRTLSTQETLVRGRGPLEVGRELTEECC